MTWNTYKKNDIRWITRLAALAVVLIVASTSVASAAPEVVNVNTASAEQLQMLPRVGPAVAERIIEFRQTNGEFKALEEVMLVRGVGEKTFDLIKPYLTLEGQTTLEENISPPRPAQSEKTQSSSVGA